MLKNEPESVTKTIMVRFPASARELAEDLAKAKLGLRLLVESYHFDLPSFHVAAIGGSCHAVGTAAR